MSKATLFLAVLGCFLISIDAELRHLKNKKEFEKFKNASKQFGVYFYNIVSGSEREKAFGLGVRDLMAVVDGHLDTLDLEIPLAFVDCKAARAEGLCDNKEMPPKRDFFLIALYDQGREAILRLQMRDTQIDDHDVLDLVLRFYSMGWRTFYAANNGKEVRKTIEAAPQRDWFVCFADREHRTAKTFCLELAAAYRKLNRIGIIQIEKRSVLQDLKLHMNVELELPARSIAHALWYFDCLQDEEGVQCKTTRYLLDASIANAMHFVNLVRYAPVMEMTPDGAIPELKDAQITLLYYFYRSVKLRWDAAKTQAFDIGNQVRGAAFVVVADVDELKESALAKFGLNVKRDTFPVWKLKLVLPEGNKDVPSGLIDVTGCPVEFVKNKLRSLFDSSSTLDDAPTSTSTDATGDDDIDPKLQDDEVELLLQSQRDEACYFCPPDYKRVTVLTDKTYQSFIDKRKTAIVLFWLNVDTTSRYALSVTIEASTILDVNYAPFGAVACHDWPDVCQKASVKTWPKMIVFSNGHRLREYKSVWDPKLLANSAMLYNAPPLNQLSTKKELEDFIASKTIRLINDTFLQTITVGLFKNEKARQIRALTEIAKRLHGQYAFGVASGSWVKDWVNERMGPLELPVIVTHKNDDELEKAVLMDAVEDATPESIARFVQLSSRPVIAPLTKLSAPAIISRKVPIIILIANNPKEAEFFAVLRNVEQCLLSRRYVCVTLDADTERNLTSHLLKAYGLHESQLPIVVYVNPKNGHVHLLPSTGAQKSIKIWLEHINSNMLKPNVILPEKTWSRPPLMYDYLELTKSAGSGSQPMHKEGGQKENARPWGKQTFENEQKEKKTCTRHKKEAMKSKEDVKLAMGKKDDTPEAHHHGHDGWHEMSECPMKRMAEEMRREEESKMKAGMMDNEEPEVTITIPDTDHSRYDEEEEKMEAKNIRKITKEILEEEEMRTQRRAASNDDDDGHDEL